MTFILYDLCIATSTIIILYAIYQMFNRTIFPKIIESCTEIIEINPKWLITSLKDRYYGFQDIDIIIVKSKLGTLPRFRLSNTYEPHLQFLIPEDVTTNDIDDIARVALAGKLQLKYGIWYPDKPAQWQSILNYMLDGGDIQIEATKWMDTKTRQKTN